MTPDYYKGKGGIQPKQLIRAFDLSFFLGNVIKYICRAGHKHGESKLEALQKARDYLNDEIENEESVKKNV